MRTLLVNPDMMQLYHMDWEIFKRWVSKHILEATDTAGIQTLVSNPDWQMWTSVLGNVGKYFNWVLDGREHTHFAPMSLLSIAPYAIEAGHEVELYDLGLSENSVDGLVEKINRFNPEVVAFTCMTPLYTQVEFLSRVVKKAKPDIISILGGHHATFCAKEILTQDDCTFDIIVRGEGEITFVEVLDAIGVGSRTLSEIEGISFREHGTVVETCNRKTVRNISSLPLPAISLLTPGKKYVYSFSLSRGCPRRCTFCSDSAMWNHQIRFYEIDRVLGEIEQVTASGYDVTLMCSDSNMLLNRNRASAFADGIGDGFFSGHYPSVLIYPGDIDEASVNLIKRMGFRECYVGVENASDRVLRDMNKGTTFSSIEESLSVLREFAPDMMVCALWIVGFPTEDATSIAENLERSRHLLETGLIDDIDAGFFVPHPGTEVYRKPNEYGMEVSARTWLDFDYHRRPTFDGKHMSSGGLYQYYLDLYDQLIELRLQRLGLTEIQKKILSGQVNSYACYIWESLQKYLRQKGLSSVFSSSSKV